MNVQINDLAYYLSDESRLTQLPFGQLDAWIDATPGSFILQFAKARKYVLEGQKVPERQLNIVAALSPNRKVLKQNLYQPLLTGPLTTEAIIKSDKPIGEPKAAVVNITTTAPKEASEPVPPKEKITKPSKPKASESIADDDKMPLTKDKKHSIKTKTPTKRSVPAKAKPNKAKASATKQTVTPLASPVKKKKKQLKENNKKSNNAKTNMQEPSSFTDWLMSLQVNRTNHNKKPRRTSQEAPKAKKRLTKAIDKIKSTSTDPVSETYADLLASQGHIKKAIEIYKKLIHLYPEKKGIFAQKLEKLKK